MIKHHDQNQFKYERVFGRTPGSKQQARWPKLEARWSHLQPHEAERTNWELGEAMNSHRPPSGMNFLQ